MSFSNLYFEPLESDVAIAVRDVKGNHLGKLITVRGIVTRVSEIKPLLQVNAYTCDVCGSETFQEISNKHFMPILDCQNEAECKKNGIHGSLHMQTRACRFSPFQEIKIQEMVRAPSLSLTVSAKLSHRPIKFLSDTFRDP
jgi:DNA replication licensing factor MCM7